jgi:hypothetical protein
MPDPAPRILLVGHCTPDAYAIRSALGNMVPEAKVEFAGGETGLQEEIGKARLFLVNRELDGDYTADDGVALIARLAPNGVGTAFMLVSNLPDAQAAAVKAGAAPGFGKRDLYADETRARLRAVLGLT